MEVKIENIDAAYLKVIRIFERNNFRILNTIPINCERYLICKTDKGNFLVMYKRDFFHNFGKIFRDQGASGMGESVNVESLKYCIQTDIDNLMFIYPDGKIYRISVEEFLNNSYRR